MLKQVKKNDILLFYPYESMDPFLKLIKDASVDPNVMTIKITIYRLAKKARLVEYLCAAAENGKEVTVLIELRARFDEQNKHRLVGTSGRSRMPCDLRIRRLQSAFQDLSDHIQEPQ